MHFGKASRVDIKDFIESDEMKLITPFLGF
jgi:hypothetical protein